jgi:hypothetical protein
VFTTLKNCLDRRIKLRLPRKNLRTTYLTARNKKSTRKLRNKLILMQDSINGKNVLMLAYNATTNEESAKQKHIIGLT